MLTSIAIIFLLGLMLGGLFKKLRLPSLMGMIFTGIIISPYVLNLIDEKMLLIAGDLRQIALVIILTRAGLALNVKDLKKVGRPAILMCFLPACFEIAGTIILAPMLLGISYLEAAILGSVIAAVSPAVIVPRMIKLIEEGYGKNKSVPQMILAGASVDDVFVIVLFTSFTALATNESVSVIGFMQIPISILLGIVLGVILGLGLHIFFKYVKMRDTVKVLVILSVSFLILEMQTQLADIVSVSGLIAIMTLGITLKQKDDKLSVRLSNKYNKLWVGAEIILFVLVGATIDLKYAVAAGVMALIMLAGALLFRMAGVWFCLIKSGLNGKEKLFSMLAYTPKATVQAAIGAVPLAMGLECGKIVLTVAVLAILVTAPFGAICVDATYKKLLEKG